MKLLTHLSIDECQARLEAAIESEHACSWLGDSGTKLVVGTIDDSTFQLRHRRHPLVRNHYAPLFAGRWMATQEGTLIEGEFEISSWAAVAHWIACGFMLLNLLFWIVFCTLGTLGWVPNFHPSCWLIPLVPVTMLSFVNGLRWWLLSIGESLQAIISNCLVTALEAKVVE